MIKEEDILQKARQLGFSNAAFISTAELVLVPEYRKYCAENLCGCYDVNPACPPQCGTVEQMAERVSRYTVALILQTENDTDFRDDPNGAKAAKQAHNRLADSLCEELPSDILRMSAGPWKRHSCMSAYCVDAQKMADAAGMICWAQDGKCRFFSLILFP